MATSLARQLNVLQSATGQRKNRGRDSLLWHARDAEDVDLDTIAGMAQNGVAELAQLDGRLSALQETLLGPGVVRGPTRDLCTSEENDKNDKVVEVALRKLGPYFMLPAAHKVMEYLIRRFGVNHHHVDAVMECILPCHDSTIFGRMVQLLKLSPLWQFLAGVKRTGTALPRSVLVSQCMKDPGLLLFVCKMTKNRVSKHYNYRPVMTFYTALVADVLSATPEREREATLRRILPFVLSGLRNTTASELQQASYLLASRIAAGGALSGDVWEELQTQVVSHPSARGARHAVVCLTAMWTAQSEFESHNLSQEVLAAMLAIPDFGKILRTVAQSYDASSLLSVYFPALIQLSVKSQEHAATLLADVRDLATKAVVPAVVLGCLQAYTSLPAEPAAGASKKAAKAAKTARAAPLATLTQTLRALTVHAQALDSALTAALAVHRGAGSNGAEQWLATVFSGSAHQLMSAGGKNKGKKGAAAPATLSSALHDEAPMAARVQALDTLLAAATGADDATAAAMAVLESKFVLAAVDQRLGDAEPGVVRRAAQLKAALLAKRPAGTVSPGEAKLALEAFTKAVHRFAPTTVSSRDAASTVRAALRGMGGPLLQHAPHLSEQVAVVLTPFLPMTAADAGSKVASAAVTMAAAVGATGACPLFAKLGEGATTPEAVVTACGAALAADAQASLPLLERLIASTTRRSTWFALAVAAKAAASGSDQHLTCWAIEALRVALSELDVSTLTASDAVAPASLPVVADDTATVQVRAAFLASALLSCVNTLPPCHDGALAALRTVVRGTASGGESATESATVVAHLLLQSLAAASGAAFALLRPHVATILTRHYATCALRAVAEIAGATGLVAPAAQARAVAVASQLLLRGSSSASGAGAATTTAASVAATVPQVLAAAASPSAAVRGAALACAKAVVAAQVSAASATSAPAMLALLAAVSGAAAEVAEDSSGAVVRRTVAEFLKSQGTAAGAVLQTMLASANPQAADLVLAAAAEVPVSALAPYANVMLQQLRTSLKDVASGSVSAAAATSFARLVSLVARVFSHADNVAVSATEELAEVLNAALTPAASASPRCFVVGAGDASGASRPWFSPTALVAEAVTPGFMTRVAATGGATAAGAVFSALMALAGSGTDSSGSTAARTALSALDLRQCDVPGYVARNKLAEVREAADGTSSSEGSRAPWVSAIVNLLEVLGANLTQGVKSSPSLSVTQQRRKRQRVPGSSPTPSAGNDNAGTITSLLVRPLTSVLEAVAQSKSNGAVDSATTEYVCLLVFTALVHAVEALIEHVDVNDAAASDAIDVDLLLQCVEDSGSLQTRSSGLLLVAKVAQLLPTAVVSKLMPMLACLGRSSLHRDDSYSFYVVQQIIEAIVPALHNHGASAGLSGFSLVGEFVGKVDSIPPHRRTALFHSVVVSLGATLDPSPAAAASYLFAVAILLLLKGPEHADTCHSLFMRFSAGQQASNLAQMLNVCRHAIIADEAAEARAKRGDGDDGSWGGSSDSDEDSSHAAGSGSDGASDDEAASDDEDSDGDEDMAHAGAGDGEAAPAAGDATRERSSSAVSIDKEAVKAQVATGMDVKALLAQLSVAAAEEAAQEAAKRERQMVDGGAAAIAAVVSPEGVDPMLMLRAVAQFVDDHLSNDAFLTSTVAASNDDAKAARLQRAYLMLSQQLFQLLHRCPSAGAGDDSDSPSALLFTVLDKLGQLMSMSTLLVVVTELLHNEDPQVGRYALRFFNSNIETRKATMTLAEVELLLDLLKELEAQLQSEDEAVLTKQTALLSVEIVCRHFGEFSPDAFLTLVPVVVALTTPPKDAVAVLVRKGKGKAKAVAKQSTPRGGNEADALRSTALLTLATLVSQLGPKTLPQLPQYMPSLLATLEARAQATRITVAGAGAGAGAGAAAASEEADETARTWVLHSALVSLAVVTERLPQFLSPYLRRVLRCTLHRASLAVPGSTAKVAAEAGAGASGAPAAVRQAADRVLTTLTSTVAARTLLPEMLLAHGWCTSKGPGCLARMLLMLKDVFGAMRMPEVVTHHARCFKFLLEALEFRVVNAAKLPATTVSSVEGRVIDAMEAMVLKMSEAQLKPMFVRVCNWVGAGAGAVSSATAPDVLAKRIAFFRVVETLACRLRSIFVPYFGFVLPVAVDALRTCTPAKSNEASKGKKRSVAKRWNESGELVHEDMESGAISNAPTTAHALRCLVVSALHKCFKHDKAGGFIGVKERFEMVMTPLLAELTLPTDSPGAEIGGPAAYLAFVTTYLAPCLGALVAATGRDVFWKPLCHRIFLATRGKTVHQRRAALACISTCFAAAGEDILVLLPEALPYLSELMEDNDADVEKAAHLMVHQLEELSGESLQSYLTN